MVEEALKEYALASAWKDYENTGKKFPIRFMASGGEFHDGNSYHWAYQKQPSFTGSNYSDNTRWEIVAGYMSVAEEDIRKATGRVNTPLEYWGMH